MSRPAVEKASMNNRDSEITIHQQESHSSHDSSSNYPVHTQLQLTLAKSETPVIEPSTLTGQIVEEPLDIQPEAEIASIYLKQASVYFQQGNWQQTINACKQALQIAPHTAEAYKLCGNVLQRLGYKSEALGCYARALQIQPDLAEVYANIGSFHAEREEWQSAIAYFEKAITFNPNLAGAYRNLAKIWEELGDSDRALRCFCQAVNLEPKTLTAAEYCSFADDLYRRGKLPEASIF
jgi:tetratricopeptide (TPR) repeat protein